METIRIGIIGAGGIVKSRHLPGLRQLEGVRVEAVCNRTRASAEAVAREWQIPRVCAEWRELVAMEDLDAVLIGTWPTMHAELSIAALEASRHVFCQARMARDFAEAQAMLACAERHPGQVAMLCPPPQGMRGDRVIRNLIGEGYLGELREVHATGFSDANLDPAAPLHWRQDFELQGYNTLTLGMWIEVIHRWVGTHRMVSAVTKTHTPFRRRPGTSEPAPVRIAESVVIGAELEAGALACYHFSGVAARAPHNRIELYGTGGTLVYDLDSDEIRGGRGPDRRLEAIPIPPELARDWTVEADFLRAIREGGPAEPSFRDGLQYMEFTEAVYRSAKQRACIDLPLPQP